MSYRIPFLAILVVVTSVLFRDSLFSVYEKFITNIALEKSSMQTESNSQLKVSVYSQEQLAKFNGIHNKKLFLVITGHIFDVSKGLRHYGPDAPYHYFIGKDGSRAFVTGNFQDEGADKDHILDLKCDDLLTLSTWKNTMEEKYKYIGVLSGRYFDSHGKETLYTHQFQERLLQCKNEKELQKKMEQKYPSCNSEWNAESGARVWCSKSSGGISRSWVGVPRLFYTPGEDRPHCVCVNLNAKNSDGQFKEYKNCSPTSESCIIEES